MVKKANVKKTEKAPDYSHLMNNPDVEQEGIIWEETTSQIRMLIVHRKSPDIEAFHNRLLMKKSNLIQTKSPEALAFVRHCATLAMAMCIKEWWGVPDPDDLSVMMPLNRDNAVRLLSHPSWRKLREAFEINVNDDDLFNTPESAAEVAAGN